MALTVTQHGDLDDAGLRQSWAELSSRSPGASLFTSYEWCECWAATAGRNTRPAILQIKNKDGRTVGLLPLCLDGPGAVRWLRFMGRDRVSGDHLDMLCLPEDAKACLDAVLEHLERTASEYDGLILGELEPGSATLAQFASWAERCGYPYLEREHRVVPYLLLPKTFEEYLASRSANMRYHVRRRQRGLAKAGGAELAIVRESGDVEAILSDFFELHRRRWQLEGLPGNFQDPVMQEFLRRFCGVAARCGWLRGYVLRADGQTQGVLIAFHWGDTANYYQMGWDPASTIPSVGVILMSASIEQAIAEGLARYDFLRGDEAYKAKWTAQASEQTTLVIAYRLPARAAMFAEQTKNAVKAAFEHCLGHERWVRARQWALGV